MSVEQNLQAVRDAISDLPLPMGVTVTARPDPTLSNGGIVLSLETLCAAPTVSTDGSQVRAVSPTSLNDPIWRDPSRGLVVSKSKTVGGLAFRFAPDGARRIVRQIVADMILQTLTQEV